MTTNLIKNTTETDKLNYSILIEAKEGGYQATVWGLPETARRLTPTLRGRC